MGFLIWEKDKQQSMFTWNFTFCWSLGTTQKDPCRLMCKSQDPARVYYQGVSKQNCLQNTTNPVKFIGFDAVCQQSQVKEMVEG